MPMDAVYAPPDMVESLPECVDKNSYVRRVSDVLLNPIDSTPGHLMSVDAEVLFTR